jgi:hypothetical protein
LLGKACFRLEVILEALGLIRHPSLKEGVLKGETKGFPFKNFGDKDKIL